MNLVWMGGEFVLKFYQTCLTLLFWLLSAFFGVGLLASVLLIGLEWAHDTGSSRRLAQTLHFRCAP